jgi:hypothetical protein
MRIEHELGKRPMHTSHPTLEQREAGAGNLGGSTKIKLAQALCAAAARPLTASALANPDKAVGLSGDARSNFSQFSRARS